MSEPVTFPGLTWYLGTKDEVGLTNVRRKDGGSLSGATALLTVYSAQGGVVYGPIAMTVTLNSTADRLTVLYTLSTGAAANIPSAGSYTLNYTITLPSGEVMVYEQPLTVKAVP
jgi:hypothetical protein